ARGARRGRDARAHRARPLPGGRPAVLRGRRLSPLQRVRSLRRDAAARHRDQPVLREAGVAARSTAMSCDAPASSCRRRPCPKCYGRPFGSGQAQGEANMADTPYATVTSGSIAEDGSEIRLDFKIGESAPQELRFSLDTFESIIPQMAVLLVRARSANRKDPLVLDAIETSAYRIGVLPEHGKLIVTFVSGRKMDFSLHLPISEGAQFRQDMLS